MKRQNNYYLEAEKLRYMVRLFGVMTKEQVAEYLGVSKEMAEQIMKGFGRLRLGYLEPDLSRVAVSKQFKDFTSKALNVYLDFMKQESVSSVYNDPRPFVACTFFDGTGEIMYEIIQIHFGEEALANMLFSEMEGEDVDLFLERRRILLLDDIGRRELVHIQDVFVVCVVDEKGRVSYYE